VCCPTGCVDSMNDNNNCGSCGVKCGPPLVCMNGICF
jgi:hypothetical protein